MSEKCATCGEWVFSSAHRCGSAWRCRYVDYWTNDVRVVYADDAEEAAGRYCASDDEPSEHPCDVLVTGEDGVCQQFSIYAEYSIEYHATQVKSEKSVDAAAGPGYPGEGDPDAEAQDVVPVQGS